MPRQSGNILWIILVSIALIGAVTATFTRSSSTSDDTGEYERNTIAASEIMRYAKSLEVAVQNLLMRGCSENELSFWHDSNGDGAENGSDDYYNDEAPEDRSCHIFTPEGAGLTWVDWTTKLSRYEIGTNTLHIAGASEIKGVGSDCHPANNARCAELYVRFRLTKAEALCRELNRIAAGPSDMPVGAGISGTLFTGSFSSSATIGIASNLLEVEGLTSACYQDTDLYNGTPLYDFYHVLIAR